ncbi:helix-turn-helix domain-containing protein [Methylomonas sp. 11b]|uniref:helix-turn-helix domain-containing protein n=1 Tax=Methylomonas sp. 11b TaxID=1168169 RepID=UPI0004B232D7|nr:recombinase family protein [Methylomonas sp. 11b]
MQVIAAVAEFERDLLIERTQAGLSRAKAAGKQFGRPPAINAEDRAEVVKRLAAGSNVSELAREFKTTWQTIMRIREAGMKSTQSEKSVNHSGE